jgi:hypothetical protein
VLEDVRMNSELQEIEYGRFDELERAIYAFALDAMLQDFTTL